ncbi:MAG: FAD-dependent oxidoreductase [Anaerolineae bacterium]
MNEQYDVIIIGAGVVGSLVARTLSRYRLHLLLVDKNSDVAEGTTKANTAIVHAGYDAKPNSLKARLNLAGNHQYDTLCGELDVEFIRCGSYVVAQDASDLLTLDKLFQRGQQNGVSGLKLLSADEMRQREPSLAPAVTGALFAASGGIVDPFQLGIGAAESAVINGVNLLLETKVISFIINEKRIVGVNTNKGSFRCRWVVVAAGLWADDLMHLAGMDGFTIKPRKGEYFLLDRKASEQVHTVLFPCPTPFSKGIMVTRTVHGNVLLGPNANTIDDKEDLAVTASGLEEVLSGARKLIPDLSSRDVIRSFAGLRATGSHDDFLIELPGDPGGLVVLAGIDSPGLTAAPAIAHYVVDLLREAGLDLTPNPTYNPERRAITRFAALSRTEQDTCIAYDHLYANVICRCETVTEGEIVNACHGVIPARTYDGLKRRTRLGAGRCQGAFDLPLVIEIMARELGVSPLGITLKGGQSTLLTRYTKEVEG